MNRFFGPSVAFISLALVSQWNIPTAFAHRSLPSGVTCGSQFASPETALVIPNPEISWANYAIYDCDHPVNWYEAAGTKDQEFKFTITIPVIERFEAVRMNAVIIGEGLPPISQDDINDSFVPASVLDYMTANNLGGVVFNSPVDQSTCDHLTSPEMATEVTVKDGRCHFYEPFGGSNLWVVMDDVYKLPTTTTYKIAVYEENQSTAKASFACCDWPEDFTTQFEMPESTCEACGTQTSNPAWASLFFEQKSMAVYGGYPPLQDCAADSTPVTLPQSDKCPSTSDADVNEVQQPESCALGCGKDGECHSHNVFGECTHELEWSLSPKFGDANVTKVVIFKGDTIKFTGIADQLAHNLFEMKDEAALDGCSFDDSTSLAGVEEINIGHEVVFDEAGTFYFTCAITNHCMIGQKLAVEVKDSTEGLRCHAHSSISKNPATSDITLPLECPAGLVNARSVGNKDYGAPSENMCAEQCAPEIAISYMSGVELGSCAELGFTSNVEAKTLTIAGSPLPVNVFVGMKVEDDGVDLSSSTITCHCHSYEKISCDEDDALYREHIDEIEEYCTGILSGDETCPYKCFQPIEVLHLHYLECPSRVKDATYTAIDVTHKCHIAAEAPSGTSGCDTDETPNDMTKKDPLEDSGSSALRSFDALVGLVVTIVLVSI